MTYLFIWFWSTISYQDYPHPHHGNISAAQVVNRVLSDETTIEEAPKFPGNLSSAGMCTILTTHYKTTKKCRIVLIIHQKCYLFSSNSLSIYTTPIFATFEIPEALPKCRRSGCSAMPCKTKNWGTLRRRIFFYKSLEAKIYSVYKDWWFFGPSVLPSYNLFPHIYIGAFAF